MDRNKNRLISYTISLMLGIMFLSSGVKNAHPTQNLNTFYRYLGVFIIATSLLFAVKVFLDIRNEKKNPRKYSGKKKNRK